MQDTGSGRRHDENLAAARLRLGVGAAGRESQKPGGTLYQGLAEHCIKDPARITIVRTIPGDTSELKAMGMLVRPDGRLVMAGGESATAAGGRGGRKRKRELPAVDAKLWELLREWKLEDVADELANEGIKHVLVLDQELLQADVEQLTVGRIHKKRLCKLLAHLHAARQERDEQERLNNADVKQVLMRMLAEPVSAQVQCEGCEQLEKLGRAAPDKKTAIAAEGGIPVVLAAMKAHAGDAEMLVQGCRVLANIAFKNDGKKTAIEAAGGIPVVLAAMKMHKGHANVQWKACWALTNLAFNGDNTTAIVASGGIPVVLAAMKAHKGHADVQGSGCHALSNTDNQIAIVAAGGIPVVLAAMKAHKGHADVQEQGCWALSHIGWSDATLQKCIKDEGGVDVVRAAVAASGATAKCKEEGQRLLGKLAQV